MGSEGRTTALRRLPRGLLGMAVLIAMTERSLVRNDVAYIEKTPASWRYSRGKAAGEGAHAEILCLGSSLTKFAVHPAILERTTGRTSYNLGLYGGRVASSYYLLEQVLAAGGRPDAVILDFYEGPVPTVAPADPLHDLWRGQRCWEELLTSREWLDLSRTAGDPAFLASTGLGLALPSVRARFDIRNALMEALGGRAGESRAATLSLIRNWNVNQGSQVMPADVPAAPAAESADPPRDPWANHRLLEAYGRRFMDLTWARGIRVFWVMPPLTGQVVTAQDRSGYSDDYRRFSRDLLRDYPNLVVIDGRNSGYAEGLFHDATHLNEAGMVSFSEDLAAVVDARLKEPASRSGSILMPPYRPRPGVPAFENVNQSRVALFPAAGPVGRF